MENKIKHIFVICCKRSEVREQNQRAMFSSSKSLTAHMFKNSFSLNPFERHVTYTLIDVDKAISVTETDTIRDKLASMVHLVDSNLSKQEAVLFSIDDLVAREKGEWLVAMYVTAWLASKYHTSFPVAFELIVQKMRSITLSGT